MKSRSVQVAHPPDKPLIVYDGSCRFCCFWVERFLGRSRDVLSLAPSQEVQDAYPEIEAAAWARSVQLIEPDGCVFEGARAAFGALAHTGKKRGLGWYQKSRLLRGVTEALYRLVAQNRVFFSRATELLVAGKRVECPPEANR